MGKLFRPCESYESHVMNTVVVQLLGDYIPQEMVGVMTYQNYIKIS